MKTINLLRSRTLALALLIAVCGTALLGTLLPQRGLTPPDEYGLWQQDHLLLARIADAAGLTAVYSAWWFLALLGLLFLSLLAFTLDRARGLWLARNLRHNALGAWGPVALHLGLLVILAGGLYSGATKAVGYFELVEGQTFTETHEGYAQLSEAPFFGERHRGFAMRLDRLQTEFWPDGELREIRSKVDVLDGRGEPQAATIRVNGALVYRGVTIYQSRQHGFAAILAVADSAGRRLGEGAVNFPTPSAGDRPAFLSFRLPVTGWQVLADLHPNWPKRAQPGDWRGELPSSPALYLTVREGDATLFDGLLTPGQRAAIGSYELAFLEVRRWAGFPVLHDNGVGVVFAGFALCVIGAAISLVRTPRRVSSTIATGAASRPALCLGSKAAKLSCRDWGRTRDAWR